MVHGLRYYRHGELTLLLEDEPDRYQAAPSQEWQPLDVGILSKLKGQLPPGIEFHDNMVEGVDGKWALQPATRNYRRYDQGAARADFGRRLRYLQTVHLRQWSPDLMQTGDIEAVAQSMR